MSDLSDAVQAELTRRAGGAPPPQSATTAPTDLQQAAQAEIANRVKNPSPADGKDAPPLDATSALLRRIALSGRDIGEGVADTFALPHDLGILMQNGMRAASNKLFGTNLQPQPTFSQNFSRALTDLGAPVPATPGEQMGSAITRGVSGALTGGGVFGLASPSFTTAPNVIRAGTAGLTGSAASEGARQMGAPAWGQFAAGLAGGLTPAALEGSARLIGNGAISLGSSIVRPLTRSGQEQMAANILSRQATDPQAAAANLANAQDLVPGSLRTSGEASQDPGLLALEKGIRAKNPGAFGERISQQNTARQAALTTLGGTPADIQAAQAARTAATDPLRAAALGNPVGGTIGAPTSIVQDTIDGLLASPSGARESVSKTLQWARGLIGDETDPAKLYEIRKDLQLAQQGRLQPSSPNAPNASTLAQARGQLGQVVDSLDNAIDWAAPGFKAYLQRYRDMSVPVDQMKAIQEIQRRASSGLDITTGQPFLGASAFSSALDRAIQRAGSRISPTQAQQLNAIRTDLQLGQALSSPLVKAPGSDTFQNLSIAQVLGAGMTDAHPALRVLTKPLSWVYHVAGSDEAVNQVLANAMLDPKLAGQLLQRATPSSVQSVSAMLKAALRNALPGAGVPYRQVPLLTVAPTLSQPQLPARPPAAPAQAAPVAPWMATP
jgi:hypothetical protein